jgi:hypothetical protein
MNASFVKMGSMPWKPGSLSATYVLLGNMAPLMKQLATMFVLSVRKQSIMTSMEYHTLQVVNHAHRAAYQTNVD